MSKRNATDPSRLSGISIYHDEKRSVYSPFFTRKAYVLNKENADQYVSYVQGYLIALLIFAVVYILYRKFFQALLMAVLFLCVNIAYFYLRFIRKAPVITDYHKKSRESFLARQARSLELRNIWTIIICCFLLSVVIIFNGYLNHFEGSSRILNGILAFISLFYGMLHIFVLIEKKKSGK